MPQLLTVALTATVAVAATCYGAVIGDCTPKGRALILAPYYKSFSASGGDESLEIRDKLAAAGYTTTFKCDPVTQDGQPCPDGRPTLDDFKRWSQYAAVVVSSHGNGLQGPNSGLLAPFQDPAGGLVVDTGVLYDALGADERKDVDADNTAKRLRVNAGTGTILLKPPWFSAYSNQMKDAVVYFSACR
jgi:hypothetical protein